MLKRLFIIIVVLICSITVNAINPSREYRFTPQGLQLEHEEYYLSTRDGYNLKVWHLPSEEPSTPIVISQSDAGNMGDWLYLGLYLQAYGFDVWMYDYRGFGGSDDFQIKKNQLFHTEFATDLDAVVSYVVDYTDKVPALMGLSMGTIVIDDYLRTSSIPITHIIYDGYVSNPKEWINKLKPIGKDVSLPKDYKKVRCFRSASINKLYIVSTRDEYSKVEDFSRQQHKKSKIVEFDSGHISAFALFPNEYVREIQSFVL